MKRLFEDPSLLPELRADLQRSRRAGEDYDALAKLPGLRAALSDPSRHIDDGPTSGAAGERLAGATRLSWPRLHVAPWTWKLALIVAIGGASLVAAWPPRRQPEPEPAAVATPQATAVAPQVPAVERRVAQPTAAAASIRVADPAPVPPVSATPQPTLSSRREIEQLVRVRALIERDPAAAYRLAQRSEQEFPRGILSEERAALQVVALVKSGAADAATRKAREFLARYPESPLRERVESAVKP